MVALWEWNMLAWTNLMIGVLKGGVEEWVYSLNLVPSSVQFVKW